MNVTVFMVALFTFGVVKQLFAQTETPEGFRFNRWYLKSNAPKRMYGLNPAANPVDGVLIESTLYQEFPVFTKQYIGVHHNLKGRNFTLGWMNNGIRDFWKYHTVFMGVSGSLQHVQWGVRFKTIHHKIHDQFLPIEYQLDVGSYYRFSDHLEAGLAIIAPVQWGGDQSYQGTIAGDITINMHEKTLAEVGFLLDFNGNRQLYYGAKHVFRNHWLMEARHNLFFGKVSISTSYAATRFLLGYEMIYNRYLGIQHSWLFQWLKV